MTSEIRILNRHATPLNNVHFGRVFYYPPRGKSLPDCRPCRLGGGSFFNRLTHGGKDMRNKGQQAINEQTTSEVLSQEWKEWGPNAVSRDSRRFEEKVRQDRIRLGLERGA